MESIITIMARQMYEDSGEARSTGRDWDRATQGDKHRFTCLAKSAYNALGDFGFFIAKQE